MSLPVHIIRAVVASPSDVNAEREAVQSVVDELNRSLCADRGIRIEISRWETDTYPGFHPDGPQGLIDPALDIQNCDILIGVFWKRFGTPTQGSGSGTEHELQQAFQTWNKKQRPQVLVYFNQKPYTPQSREETDEWGKVLQFRKNFPREGLWWPYAGAAKFESLLRKHLTNYIRVTFPLEPTLEPTINGSQRESRSDYFAVQARIIDEYTSTFVGRTDEKKSIRNFLETERCGYVIVQGAPGQGKTALLCDLVNEWGYIHHFISHSGGRADSRLILCSLIVQLESEAASKETFLDSLAELTKRFEELLHKASAQQAKTVIVIDALDELGENLSEEPFLVINPLPIGVFYVVSSRNGQRLDRLKERLFATSRFVIDLGPMNRDEARKIILRDQPDLPFASVELLVKVSQGNPLYLHATAAQMRADHTFSLSSLPPTVEGFFSRAMGGLDHGNVALRDVLGLLAASRSALSLSQLSEILKIPQRTIAAEAITPIRAFLFEVDGSFVFFHTRFHEFVLRNTLYHDELRTAHQRIVRWLQEPANLNVEYRFNSLAFHLFESREYKSLVNTIDERYLGEKVQRLGYAVLEDIELLTRALLILGDPGLVTHCVALVQSLAQSVGGDMLPDAVRAIQSQPINSKRNRLLETTVPHIPGLDLYVGMLPKAQASADFIELVERGKRLLLAIGDVPNLGLSSAFAARFLGNLFNRLVTQNRTAILGNVLNEVNATIRGHDLFERISMQCVEIEATSGVARLSNAGHPFPVHYSARRKQCDVLPLRGELLNDPFDKSSAAGDFETYKLVLRPGDVLVFVTDGLTEDHVIRGNAYGYGFVKIVEDMHSMGARAIGEAILENWKMHPRDEDAGDDVTIAVVAVKGDNSTNRSSNGGVR